MPEKKDTVEQTPPTVGNTPNEQPQTPPAQEAVPPQEEKKLDETVPGGRYLVGGRLVDANGQPIKE